MVGRLFVAGAIFSFSIPCYAGIWVDPNTCPSSVTDHANDARQMAKTASDALNNKSPRDASTDKGLFQVLFDEADRSTVQDFFNKVASLDSSSDDIRIYCGEDNIYWPQGKDKNTDTTTYYVSKDWDDKQGGRTQEQDLGVEDNPAMPRRTRCEDGVEAYTINGFEERAGESHIIVCTKMLIADGSKDRRRIGDIASAGLDPRWYSLDLINPLGHVLLHEFMHLNAVSGPLQSDYRTSISDIDEVTGITDCYNRRKSDSRAAVKNADSFSLLGMGLSLQFESKRPKFSWVAGAVNVGNGQTDYAPYVKPRTTKRALDALRVVGRRFTGATNAQQVPQIRGKVRGDNFNGVPVHLKQSQRLR